MTRPSLGRRGCVLVEAWCVLGLLLCSLACGQGGQFDSWTLQSIQVSTDDLGGFSDAPATVPGTLPAAAAPAPAPAAPLQQCVPQAKLDAIGSRVVKAAPAAVDFAAVDVEAPINNVESIRLENTAATPQTIIAVSCPALGAGVHPEWFTVAFSEDNVIACKGEGKVPLPTAVTVTAKGAISILVTLTPTALGKAGAVITFWSSSAALGLLNAIGSGGDVYAEGHTLHPIIDGELIFAEPETKGGAEIDLSAVASHTHAGGVSLVAYEWSDLATGAVVAPNATAIACWLPFGTYTFSMKITDSVGGSDVARVTFAVAPLSNIPGTLIEMYAGTALDPVPAMPSWADVVPETFEIREEIVKAGPQVVRFRGKVAFDGGPAVFGLGDFAADAWGVWIDGKPAAKAGSEVSAGVHVLDVRILMPLTVEVVVIHINDVPIASSYIDISDYPPIINELDTDENAQPGQMGVIKGLLLGAPTQISVRGVPAQLTSQTAGSVSFTYPSVAPGPAAITASRGALTSNSVPVVMQVVGAGIPPTLGGEMSSMPVYSAKSVPLKYNPSRVKWCHGKLYVAPAYTKNAGAALEEITFDSNYEVVAHRTLMPTPQPYPCPDGYDKCAWSILGMACDPREGDTDWKLWFALSQIYPVNGLDPKEPAGFPGFLYYLQPTDAAPKAVQVMKNLPVSNHDHGINELAFLHDGRLLIQVGGNTNAGITAQPIGFYPEGPLTGAILVADVNKPGFDGNIVYGWLDSVPAEVAAVESPGDVRFSTWLKVTSGDVEIFATGMRNPFGLQVTRDGRVVVADEGPNVTFGPKLSGVTDEGDLQTLDPTDGAATEDSMFFDLKEGCHSSHPNPARCLAGDLRECQYVEPSALVHDPPKICKPDIILESPACGLVEYDSYAFGGENHGHYFVTSYKKWMFHVNPFNTPPTYITDEDDSNYPPMPSVDVTRGPAGVLLVADLGNTLLNIVYPVDSVVAAHTDPVVYDVLPDRGPKVMPAGGISFIIGGANFDSITGPVAVTFGGAQATGVKVLGPAWIGGFLPSNPAGLCSVDVSIAFGATRLTLPKMFCYLPDVGAAPAATGPAGR